MKHLKTAAKSIIMALILILAGLLSGAPGEASPDSGKLKFDFTPKQLEAALKSGRPTLLDISAVWCEPCYVAAPAVENLKEKYAGQANIMTVNYDEAKRLSSKYGVSTLPSFIFFNKEGKNTEVISGFESEGKLENMVQELLK